MLEGGKCHKEKIKAGEEGWIVPIWERGYSIKIDGWERTH